MVSLRSRLRRGLGTVVEQPAGSISLSNNTVDPNATQGEVVGTYTKVGGGTITGAAINNTDFQLSATSGTSIQLQRSGTGTLSAGGTESVTFTADAVTALASTINVDTLPTDITLSASSIVENAAAGTVVGVLSTTGGRAAYTYSVTVNTDFTISGSNLVRSSSGGTLVDPESVTVRTTDANGNTFDEIFSITVTSAASGQFLTTFSVTEWNNASSTGFLRFGLPFKQGDIPSGSVPEVRVSGGAAVTAIQFDERVTWPDGSLAFCVCHANLGSFTALQTKDYEVYRVTGTFSNTGTKALSDITGTHDFKVAFSSFAQWDGTSSTTRGSGAFTATFNTQAAVATRCWKYHSGPVCESWYVWGPALDDTGGAADAHLTTEWYVSIWKNTNDTINDFEYCAVPSQYWWSVASKFRLDYTATLKNGGSTVETYASVQHPYRAQWATVRKTADNNHARRFWVTAVPTLMYKPSKSYWRQSGYIPPYDANYTPNASNYSVAYAPCDDINHGTAINSTGPYQGRGLLNDSDLRYWMRMSSAQDLRYARTNAFFSLHIPYHFRSNRTRQRPASAGCPGGDATADTAATVPSLILDPLPSSEYDFTADGMPIAVHASSNSSSSASFKDGYVSPLGGVGVFQTSTFGSGDSSHARRASYFMYLLEGERMFMQAGLDLALKATLGLQATSPNQRPRTPWYSYPNSVYQPMFNIPLAEYGAIAELGYYGNTRHIGWAMDLLGHAWATCPDNDPQRGFIEKWVTHNFDFFRLTLDYMPASHLASGSLETGTDQLWHIHICALGCFQAYQLTKHTGALDMGNFFAKAAIGLASTHPYRIAHTGHLVTPITNTQWNATTNDFFAPADFPRVDFRTVSIDAATDTITWVETNWAIANGDKVRPIVGAINFPEQSVPSELSEGEPLYLINVSGNTSKVSRTLGGSAVDFVNNYTTKNFAAYQAEFNNYTSQVNPPYLHGADSYSSMAQAVVNFAAFLGNSSAQAQVAGVNTFCQNIDTSNWVTWRLRAS